MLQLRVLAAAFLVLACAFPCRAAAREIRLEERPGKLAVQVRTPGDSRWSDLALYQAELGSRPYLHPVFDPSGGQVLTDNRPSDHPWQHGIFTGFHRVNGVNYWKEDEGRQRLAKIFNLHRSAEKAGWTALVELVSPAGEVVLEEENVITFHTPRSGDSFLIDFDLLLRAKTNVVFGKFFVGGLSVRMPWDAANPRQAHLNSEGIRGRSGEQRRAAWCTVERPFGAEVFGFAVLDHPSNPNHPPAWRVDEQGLINPNASGLADWTLKAGEERRFRNRIVAYSGAATAERVAGWFETYQQAR
jgi:hypothetical protein